MKIVIDSAELSEIEEAYCCGMLDGVTTKTPPHEARCGGSWLFYTIKGSSLVWV